MLRVFAKLDESGRALGYTVVEIGWNEGLAAALFGRFAEGFLTQKIVLLFEQDDGVRLIGSTAARRSALRIALMGSMRTSTCVLFIDRKPKNGEEALDSRGR